MLINELNVMIVGDFENTYQKQHNKNIINTPLYTFKDYTIAKQYLQNTSKHQNTITY